LDNELIDNKQDGIHAKGFDIFNFGYANPENIPEGSVNEYGKIKVGVK
jgi:hypothetical protein